MHPEEFIQLQQSDSNLLFIDIREQYEYDFENLGAKHIPLGEILNRLNEIPKNKPVVFHCQSGSRAEKMVAVLRSMGYEHVFNLIGGLEGFNSFRSTQTA